MKKQKSKKSRLAEPKAQPDVLEGWTQIAQFLGQPIAVAQRRVRSGMPVKREGQFMTASPQELSRMISSPDLDWAKVVGQIRVTISISIAAFALP